MKIAALLAATFLALPGLASAEAARKGKAPPPAPAAATTPASAADQALANLKKGNERFVAGKLLNDHRSPDVRKHLAKGQAPEAIVVTCADSRLPPEQIFDQGLGKLFTVRGAGNVVHHNEIASIEYAVAHLGSKLIVIMGHEHCGAVKAALSTPAGTSAGSPSLDALVHEINGCMAPGSLTEADRKDPAMRAAARANTEGVAKKLIRESKIVRDAVEQGAVRIVPAVYALDTGKVTWGDAAPTTAAR